MHELFYELLTVLEHADFESMEFMGAQEHHLLTVLPQCLALLMKRVSAAEQELLKSIGDHVVRLHAQYCEDAHGDAHALLPAVADYRDWHHAVMRDQPLPFALGAALVMYGHTATIQDRLDALIEPYRARQDLIDAGANRSRVHTVRVWDALVARLSSRTATSKEGAS